MTVFAAPLRDTLDVPCVNVAPVPEVSQFPLTVHAPVVRVIVPLAPPVIVTFVTLTVEAFAVSTAPFPTVRVPPVRERFAVARVAFALRVSVPPHRSPFEAIVKVAAADGLSWRLLNSFVPRLPNV